MKPMRYGVITLSPRRHYLTVTAVGNQNHHHKIAEFSTLTSAMFVQSVLNKYGDEEHASQLIRQVVNQGREENVYARDKARAK